MEIDQKQTNEIMSKLNQLDEIMNKLKELDEIKEELKQFDEIKEEQRKMTIEMIRAFGKLEKKIDDNMEIVQRQISENNLKEEKRYQKQLETNEMLKASIARLDNLAIQNIEQHETYDNILQIKCKTSCV